MVSSVAGSTTAMPSPADPSVFSPPINIVAMFWVPFLKLL
jgi:hypothetical protein